MPETGTSAPHWYDVAFGRLYPKLYRHRSDDAAAREASGLVELLGLRPEAGLRILDVCCGTARHMAPLLRMGFHVWGVDRSAALLAQALQRPAIGDRLARADIRALPFGPCFDVVLNLFTSFGYFSDETENRQALREMTRALRPGGRLVIDHMNRPEVERSLIPFDTRTVDGVTVEQRRWIEGDRIRKQMDLRGFRGERLRIVEDVRLYRPDDMRALLQSAGLGSVRLYGSLHGVPYNAQSDRMVAVARK